MTLTLIPFAPQSLCLDVSQNLSRLGYRVDLIDQAFSLDRCIDNLKGVLVFLFGSRGLRKDTVVSLLARAQAKPRFGIFVEGDTMWDAEIVGRCNEFLNWPCPDREIAFRLDRLYDYVCPQSSNVDVTEQLMQLNMVGRSPAFDCAVQRIRKFAQCDAPVLIEGETGTGKELAARAIHYLSHRQSYPFIPINCGALPDNLVENELFGHEKGAYTDARTAYMGLVAQAEGGTLFLDEIEALSSKAQVTLLRFLQEQEYRPLGAHRFSKANVRVVTASNSSLFELVKNGHFRSDLMFRLNIMPLVMPPLRQRIGDIELLAEHFISSHRLQYNQPDKYLSVAARQWLNNYSWPGNVRELENLLHREFLLAEGDAIEIPLDQDPALEEKRASVGLGSHENYGFNEAKARAIEAFERDYLLMLMAESHGNVTLAAKRAGKERRSLGKLLKKHRIDKSDYL
jgi:DNA-binding NtrC family response regulator